MARFRGDGKPRYGGRDSPRSGSRFRGRDSGRSRFGGRYSGRSERPPLVMHKVTCDKCGKETEVPFKPTNTRPVYCRECFQKGGNSESRDRPAKFANSESRSRSDASSEQLSQINTKLDKIMKALKIE